MKGFSLSLTTLNQIVRSCLAIVLSVVFANRVLYSFQRWQNTEIGTSLTTIKHSQPWPALTFCIKNVHDNVTAINLDREYHQMLNRTDLIKSAFLANDHIISDLQEDKFWTEFGFIHWTLNVMSRITLLKCFMVHVPQEIPSVKSAFSQVNFQLLSDSNVVDILVDNEANVVPSLHGREETGVMQFINERSKSDIIKTEKRLTISKKVSLNNCENNPKISLRQCVNDYIKTTLKCRLPWDNESQANSCNEKLDDVKDLFILLNSISLDDLAKDIGCSIPCERAAFNAKGDENLIPKLNQSNSDVRLNIVSTQKSFEVHKEYKVYTISNLIADIGGYLGLLLGGSILSLVDFVVQLITRCSKK